jgi:hypothetical protein
LGEYNTKREGKNLRVYKKNSSFKLKNLNKLPITNDNSNYEQLYENVISYLVFKISIITDLKERLAYLDVKDYMERIQLEDKRLK